MRVSVVSNEFRTAEKIQEDSETKIKENKTNELELKRINKLLNDMRFALDASATVSITDLEGRIIFVNDRFCEVSNFSREEVIGQKHSILNSDFHSPDYFKKMWETINEGKVWNGEIRNRTKDGEFWWANATIVPIFDDNHSPYQFIAIRSDITDRKIVEEELIKQKEKVEYMAYYDHLTGLPNRKSFEDKLDSYIKEKNTYHSKFGLLFLDLDGFKYINDTLGHGIGDKLLRAVAKRLNENLKNNDFIARIGGDEFTIISRYKDKEVITYIAEEVLAQFVAPFMIETFQLYITASIGISIFPNSGSTSEELIKNADLAMYRAKDAGKNRYEIFSPTINVEMYKRFTLQNDLRKALHNEEILLHYQPRVDSETNCICGMEALARWQHPDWGMVSPIEFIPIAEQTGLINQIGEFVLLRACKQNKQWQNEGYRPVKVSVNFSPLQLLQANIVKVVKNTLDKTGLDPQWLEIEITETAVIKYETGALSKLEQLKSMGISIAIDDFGTGFSSLSYLRKIKPHTIKIDRSFIKEIPDNFESTEIVSAIIRLAKNLNINIVAEGVESVKHHGHLLELQCNELQGYLYSKPVPSKEFELLLKSGHISNDREGIEVNYTKRLECFRIDLPFPLEAQMTVVSVNGKEVRLGMMNKISIENIGPGGLRFYSAVLLPAKKDIVLKFELCLLNQEFKLTGTIVWSKELINAHQYGIQFIIDEKEHQILTNTLIQLQLRK